MSNQKIVFAILFVCGALFSSLFIYHLRTPNPHLTSTSSDSFFFAEGREIKSFNLTQTDNEKLSQTNFFNHWTLLFFGFTHCSSICPTTLDLLNRAYLDLQPRYENLQVIFISLDPDRDTLTSLANYTHGFNPHFIAATGKLEEIRKLQSQLGIFAARDETANGTNYQLIHTNSILMINPQGKWVGLYKSTIKPAALVQDFTQFIKTRTSNRNA